MRIAAAVILALALPALAAAQSSNGASTESSTGSVTGLGPIGLPLPTIGLPLPSIGLSPVEPNRPSGGKPEPGEPNRGRRPRHPRPGPSVVYVVPYYGYDQRPESPSSADAPAESNVTVAPAPAAPETGQLRLVVRPAVSDFEIFVDGAYIGTASDVGEELELEAGRHHVEIRARDFEEHAFDVQMTASRSITYRASLTRVPRDKGAAKTDDAGADSASKDASPPPVPRSTIYFIPGCYLGNVPPSELSLPTHCDLKKMVTSKP